MFKMLILYYIKTYLKIIVHCYLFICYYNQNVYNNYCIYVTTYLYPIIIYTFLRVIRLIFITFRVLLSTVEKNVFP